MASASFVTSRSAKAPGQSGRGGQKPTLPLKEVRLYLVGGYDLQYQTSRCAAD